MRLLVTGATGFIGRQVLNLLTGRLGDIEVIAAARRPEALANSGVRIETVDLLRPGAAAALIERIQPTHVLHLAWNADPGVFWRAQDNLDWMAASLTLASAFIAAGGRRMVVAGSVAEYAWDHARLEEQVSPLAPATLYGAAKDATRRALEAATAGTPTSLAWGRVFWLYGPHEQSRRLVSDVAAALARGEPVDCSSGEQIRDFMHVTDVAGAFVAALDSDWRGAFNIASGQGVAVRDVVNALGRASSRPELIRLGARPSPMNDPPELVGSNRLLRDEIGYSPRIDLADGLKDTFAWWRAHVQVSPSIPRA